MASASAVWSPEDYSNMQLPVTPEVILATGNDHVPFPPAIPSTCWTKRLRLVEVFMSALCEVTKVSHRAEIGPLLPVPYLKDI